MAAPKRKACVGRILGLDLKTESPERISFWEGGELCPEPQGGIHDLS